MKKFLLSLISVLALSSAASAASVAIPGDGETWASYEWAETNSDGKVIKMEAVIGDFTFTYDKGTSTSDIANANPADVNQLRIYAGSSITITSSIPFTKITGVVASSSKATDATLSDGWALEGTLQAKANTSFTFVSTTPQTSITFSGNNKQFRISSLVIETSEDPIEATVETPEITPATGKFGGPQQVSISCATEGAAIYYTTDGTAPTSESTLYEAPFTVSTTTTVKAIAYVDTDASKVASSTITILDSYESLTGILNFGPKPEVGVTSEEFMVACDLIVAYVNGANVIVTDEVGHSYALIYKYDTGLQAGDVVAGGWTAAIQNYKGLYELIPSETLTTNGTADVPAFEEINDMSVLDESYVCHIVVVKNVYFAEATPDAGSNFTATQNDTDYTLYNKFKLASVEAGLYDVTMVVWMFDTLCYYPLEYTPAPTPIEVPENLYIMGEAFGSNLMWPNLLVMEKEGNKFTYSGVADNSQPNFFVFTTNNESEISANANALHTAEQNVAVDNTYELVQGYETMLIAEGSYTLTVTYYDYRIELSITNYDSSALDITNDAAAPVEYFNLQGVRVAEPAAGALYIVRQGSTVTKRAF